MDETVGKDGAEGAFEVLPTAPRARRCWRPTRDGRITGEHQRGAAPGGRM